MGNPSADRLLFFDMVRSLAMLSVVLFHAVAAYSSAAPHWGVHDGTSGAADVVRHLFDVFQMPVFFFAAGYFALSSLATQGRRTFILSKLRRIGVPWLAAVLLVVPMVYFKTVPHAPQPPPFWLRWLDYLSGFGQFQIGPMNTDQPNQLHFWFLSLLLSFFMILAVFRGAGGGEAPVSDDNGTRAPASKKSILTALFMTGAVTSIAYWLVMLAVPAQSWATVKLLLSVQITGLIVYCAFFVLGVFAASRRWFEGDGFPGGLMVWTAAAAVLTACFFVLGGPIFNHPADSQRLSPLLLLAFSFVRTFLCLTFLVVIVAYARRFWNRPSGFSRKLSVNSYNIYLVHFFFVVGLQDSFKAWAAGPPAAKAAIVFLLALPLSYGFSLVMDRFPRGFACFLMGIFVLHCIGRYIGL